MEVERLVRTQISTTDLDPPRELVQGVNNGEVQLLQVVKALGEFLTSQEDGTRLNVIDKKELGLMFLTNLLDAISRPKVTRQASMLIGYRPTRSPLTMKATTLVQFYLSKLDDFDSLPPALNGLTVLSKLATFDDAMAVEVYHAIVENINIKAYVQATRHLVYVLFDSLLTSHRNALKKMGSAFINSYIKMVDGEKDPRNLMLLFSLDRIILLEFDVHDHIEDFFDVTFCYFPISFRPPPNDPYGITADDLKVALRECMSASPYFAKMALPLFLEKFATATGPAMKDLMLSMAACFPTYGADALIERAAELWEGIKTEILYSSDQSVESAALTALESLMHTLYPNESDSAKGLAQDVIKECAKIFEEPDKNQAVCATNIIAAIFKGSPSAGKFALSQILPQFIRTFNSPSLPSHRVPLLSSISSILIACQSVYTSSTRSYELEQSLKPYQNDLFDILREGLRTESLKRSAIRGVVASVGLEGYLEKFKIEELVKDLDDILVSDEDSGIRLEVIQALTTISTHNPSTIESITLPLLFHNLPDQAPSPQDFIAREKYRSILDSLNKLCIQPALWQTMIVRITTKLDLLTSSANATSAVTDVETDEVNERECNIAYAWDLLHCLLSVLRTKIKAKHVDVAKHYDELIPRLYGFVIHAGQKQTGRKEALFRDRRLLRIVAIIGREMIHELTIEKQAKQLDLIYAAFERGDMKELVFENIGIQNGSPLRVEAPQSEQDLFALYSAAFQSLSSKTHLSLPNYPEYLNGKFHWTINVAKDDWQVAWGVDMICALVNKKETGTSSSLSFNLPPSKPANLIFDLTWFTHGFWRQMIKALALLSQPLAYSALEKVISILSLFSLDPELVQYAAEGFGVLAKKGDGYLITKLLYAQKLWNFVLPRLIEGDKEASGKERTVYLVAFASLLPVVPASLCISDLTVVLPLMLRSLSLSSPQQRINIILALISIFETPSSPATDSLLHSSATALVQSLLSTSLVETDVPTSAKVRQSALTALAVIPDIIRFETLHKDKGQVIKELGKAVDDKSRDVRKEAVECRAKWFRYGQAT
nr:DNA repair/transcription protein MET18/MMS19 [Cryptococcus depauperatus CBS 7841]